MIDPMFLAIVVVLVVLFLQGLKFYQNRKRIKLFSCIFSGQDYDLRKDENGLVVGITGTGNKIFDEIKQSINGYLRGTQGTEVDFQLLKDSVDRHCDMIEDEINSQMPLPLYFGLAGTMLGAIIGLLALVSGEAILKLMSGDSSSLATDGVANNINDLLWGVAIAMVASAVGIGLTSWNTIFFKDNKLKEETEKNKFLAWMQSRVLSAVPSSVSQQMKTLATQLSTFNRNFKSNTDAINFTLAKAKEVYQSQAKVIEEYKQIDLESVATNVSSIMRRLRSSTESLDNFTQYLNTVHDYYKEIQVFANNLNKETERIGILQDIQKFFQSHKGVIAEETADAHKNIQKSIEEIGKATEQQVNETYTALTEQSKKLKAAIDENNRQFSSLCEDMRIKFKEQMNDVPSVAKNLEEIPKRLDDAIAKIIHSQDRLAGDFLKAAERIASTAENRHYDTIPHQSNSKFVFPASIKWTIILGVSLMALATIGNTAYNIWRSETAAKISATTPLDSVVNETSAPIQYGDTTSIQNI